MVSATNKRISALDPRLRAAYTEVVVARRLPYLHSPPAPEEDRGFEVAVTLVTLVLARERLTEVDRQRWKN